MYRNYVNDTVLLDAIHGNDTAAFETLIQRYWYYIYQFSFGKSHCEKTAKDITRKIFVELWENRNHIPPDFSLQSYFTIKMRWYLVDNLYLQLNKSETETALINEALSSFSLDKLRCAYLPVKWSDNAHQGSHKNIYVKNINKANQISESRMSIQWKLSLYNIALGFKKTFF